MGKGNFILQRRKSAEKTKNWPPNATKKAVLLKNCFVYLYSKNDNSIKLPSGEKSHRRFRSTGFHFLFCEQNESLVISGSFYFSYFNLHKSKYCQLCDLGLYLFLFEICLLASNLILSSLNFLFRLYNNTNRCNKIVFLSEFRYIF